MGRTNKLRFFKFCKGIRKETIFCLKISFSFHLCVIYSLLLFIWFPFPSFPLNTDERKRKNLILPSFITRKETKPSSLASSRPSFGEKFKFGFYYLSFFEYGETFYRSRFKETFWKESPFVIPNTSLVFWHKFNASPSFSLVVKVKKMPAALATALQACPKP